MAEGASETVDTFLYWDDSIDKLGSKVCKHYVAMFDLIDKDETEK